MLGISPGNLGLYSARKGASSHASSSTTVSPPMVSICLCAMWSMGHVKECYLQFEKAGEHYLGQVLCGLNVNDVKFAVSRTFFDFDANTNGTEEGVFFILRDYMIGGDHVCVSVHPIFYFCFASSTDHFNFLSLVLHQRIKCGHCISSTTFNRGPKMLSLKLPWAKLKRLPPSLAFLLTLLFW